MARKKTIKRDPSPHKNYFLVDANFLAYKALPQNSHKRKQHPEAQKIERAQSWWKEITKQLKEQKARVYILDVVIAEAFKVLAKKYYGRDGKWFSDANDFNAAKKRLRKFVSKSHSEMAKASRFIDVHDIPTSRDLVIAVDRFYEPFLKAGINIQIADLLLIASAKYLMDFFDLAKEHIFIITGDRKLVKGIRKIPELPNAIDPEDYDPKTTFV